MNTSSNYWHKEEQEALTKIGDKHAFHISQNLLDESALLNADVSKKLEFDVTGTALNIL
ncbi:hypothetical protein [Peribacillus kribbensis]|uniref:hypothetical protein n=1 Tax=Peribacillus kribbensis TaxID=356658 RepID=UPI0003FC8C8F|nr:hypothetical protein [Peribacillus kribbensis]